jgi:hypothetical protein
MSSTSAPELYRFRIRCRSCRVLRKRKRKAAAQSSFANFVSYADTANSKKFRATASKRTLRTIFSRGAQELFETVGVVMR